MTTPGRAIPVPDGAGRQPVSGVGRRRYGKRGLGIVDLREDGALSPAELSIGVAVKGGLDDAYLGRGNAEVVPSDGLREALLACVARHVAGGLPIDRLFAQKLGDWLLERFPFLPRVATTIRTSELRLAGRKRGNLVYLRARGARAEETVTTARGPVAEGRGSVRRLGVVLTGRHSFFGFHGDDGASVGAASACRVLVGTINCRWQLRKGAVSDGGGPDEVRSLLLSALTRDSRSVQHLLTSTASELLQTADYLERARLSFRSLPVAPAAPSGPDGRLSVVTIGRGPVAVTSVTVTRAARDAAQCLETVATRRHH